MKKQIFSIILMIVAILIVCAGLYMKKQSNTASVGGTDAEYDTPNGMNRTSMEAVQPTTLPIAATTLPPAMPSATPVVTAIPTTPQTTVTPAPTPQVTARPADTKPTAKPTTAPTAAPTAEPTAPPASDSVTVTDAYPSDTVNMLTSLGLSAEDINTLADMGVTEEEIQSVTSAVDITPEMVAELHNYKDIWKNASKLERKLMIEMLKQLAGQ